jgi:hypothetical protein
MEGREGIAGVGLWAMIEKFGIGDRCVLAIGGSGASGGNSRDKPCFCEP